MEKIVLHISHTDINVDSRILKEILAIRRIDGVCVRGVGVAPDDGPDSFVGKRSVEFDAVVMKSTKLKFLPKFARYILNICELTFLLIVHGKRTRVDVVHCHDTLALIAGVMLKFLTGSKLVYDAHELESRKNQQNSYLRYSTLLIEKCCWRFVDLFVSVSDSILNWYHNEFGVKPSILVLNSPLIPTPTDSSLVDTVSNIRSERYFHKKFHLRSEAIVFLYLGILSPGRGLQLALNAFAALDDRAVFVAVGFGELKDLVCDYSSRHNNIFYHEPVSHGEVVPLARSADVGICLIENVSLSDYFCLPNKLFEYAFADLYVLASDFPEISNVLTKYSLGVTVDLNVDAIKTAVRSVSEQTLRRNVIDLSPLGWEAQAQRLIGAYKLLLSPVKSVAGTVGTI